MTKSLGKISRHQLIDAATKAAAEQGYSMEKFPGRGLSSIWNITKDNQTQVASIRTTQDRWIAFPPLEAGTKWKTLDEVDTVIVATVDNKESPENIEVYIFPASDVRKRFDAAYEARKKNGQSIKDNFGMWVGLDHYSENTAASIGSGIIEQYECIATYPISDLKSDKQQEDTKGQQISGVHVFSEGPSHEPATISDIMSYARDQIAKLAAVSPNSVKLDLKIEY